MRNFKVADIRNKVILKSDVKKFQKEEGITLIALVITIIVLLILAGVSISLVIGNNGILTQASNSVVTNDEAKIKEEISMAASSWSSENYVSDVIDGEKSDTAFENFKKSLPTNFTAIENADGTLLVSGEYKGFQYKYFILEDGSVVSDKLIERVKQGDYINYSSKSLSGGENWRVLYTENNRIYLVSICGGQIMVEQVLVGLWNQPLLLEQKLDQLYN